MWATRFWWMLRSLGFDRAAVLDGGLDAWTAEGRPTESGPAKGYPPTTFVAAPRRASSPTSAPCWPPRAIGARPSSTPSGPSSTGDWSPAATGAQGASPGASTCRRPRSWPGPRPSRRWTTPGRSSRPRASPRTSASSATAEAASRPPSICSCCTSSATTRSPSTTAPWASGPTTRHCRSRRTRGDRQICRADEFYPGATISTQAPQRRGARLAPSAPHVATMNGTV